MVKSGPVVVSGPSGTAFTAGPTRVMIRSSVSEGDVGMPPSSLPGEGAMDTPEGDVGGEGLPLTGAHSCRGPSGTEKQG